MANDKRQENALKAVNLLKRWGSAKKASEETGIPRTTLRHWIKSARDLGMLDSDGGVPSNDLEMLKNRAKVLLKEPLTLRELCDALGVAPKVAEQVLADLELSHTNLFHTPDDKLMVSAEIPTGGNITINLDDMDGKMYRFGFISDNHYGSKFERQDVANALYDIFEKEGITQVLHAGNMIDGERRFNKQELLVHGMDPQVDYFVKNYPQRKGITTYFVTGDDHEGWYVQDNTMNIGNYIQWKAEKAGRHDLIHLGYVEADIELKREEGSCIVKLMHPGGGTAYAVSYTPQKIIESFTGGEKPQVLFIGHYHKLHYLYFRGVHCVQTGCTQDQTTFMRKKRIPAHVGGGIAGIEVARDGSVMRFVVELFPFYDKEFYKRREWYNEGMVKHTV